MPARENEKHKVWIDFGVRVAMRDGVELSADIYRPKESRDGERFPAVLLRTPYNRATEKIVETGNWFAERGYAVVMMDVRGRGDSEGEFRPYRSEGHDSFDSVEWCAAQAWCNGKVATMGGSYLGHIQWLTALQHPPHLVTMIVLVTPSDPFVEWPTGSQSPMNLCRFHLTSGGGFRSPGPHRPAWHPVGMARPLVEGTAVAGGRRSSAHLCYGQERVAG